MEVTGLAVDGRGNLYVGDFYTAQIGVVSPRGEILYRLGGRGSGPGEFEHIRVVQAGLGDTLFVYDSGLMRLTKYAPGSKKPAEVVSFAHLAGVRPHSVWLTADHSNYLVLSQEIARINSAGGRQLVERLTLHTLDGTAVGNPIFVEPRADMVRVEVGNSSYLTPNPFVQSTHFDATSAGAVAFVSMSTNNISLVPLDGSAGTRFATGYQPPSISGADLEDFMDGIPLEWARPAVRRFLTDQNADHWPAFTALVADDRNRVWLRLGASPAQAARWALFTPSGDCRALVELPGDAVVMQVVGRQIYTARTSPQGDAYVSVFEM